jgi:hypothetical protein
MINVNDPDHMEGLGRRWRRDRAAVRRDLLDLARARPEDFCRLLSEAIEPAARMAIGAPTPTAIDGQRRKEPAR